MVLRMKEFLAIHEPLALHYRVNAGVLPPDHWINDPEHGGGRIVGEVCHFVDLLSFLAGALPIEVYARALANNGLYSDDNVFDLAAFRKRLGRYDSLPGERRSRIFQGAH